MNDLEKELALLIEQEREKAEVKLPSLDEQKEIVAKLKALEESGELTEEVLEQHFGQFYAETNAPVH